MWDECGLMDKGAQMEVRDLVTSLVVASATEKRTVEVVEERDVSESLIEVFVHIHYSLFPINFSNPSHFARYVS